MARRDLIGVVTVTYNSAAVLPDFLRCMANQTHREFLLFAVDNASRDDTRRMLRECADPRLRIIANPDNNGVARGNNQGIRAALDAGCSSVMLINNDTEFDPDLIAQLDQGLHQYHAEMTCPKILYFDDPTRIWAAGGAFQSWLGYRTVHIGVDSIDDGRWDTPSKVTYAPTCCVLIRASVFARVGLMDELYFVYVDDVDFMYRALKMKQRLFYLPNSRLLHKVGTLTGGATTPFHIRYCARNRMFFALKHFGMFRAAAFNVLNQIHLMLKFISGKVSIRAILIRERAMWEGVSMWRSSKKTDCS